MTLTCEQKRQSLKLITDQLKKLNPGVSRIVFQVECDVTGEDMSISEAIRPGNVCPGLTYLVRAYTQEGNFVDNAYWQVPIAI